MPHFTVYGVNKETSSDITMTIEADTEANARVKAELQGIVVTRVTTQNSSTPPNIQNAQLPHEELKPGESIDKGFCPTCGDAAIKTTGQGYNPGCGGITIHLLLCLVTLGGWLPFFGGWALYHHIFNKGKKTCMHCSKSLQA